MKIRCIANKGTDLPENYLNPPLDISKETEFKLIVGKEYIVYAISEWQGNLSYYICDERYTYYPIHNPAPLFEIVDARYSRYWQVQLATNGLLEIAFEHWFSIPNFYDQLTDGETETVLIFEKIKELMDAEAAIPQPQPFSVEELLAMPTLQPDKLAKVPG
ncbi:hypothetical protein [Microcoleus sp. PH2017_30_WIL_O_A]|jgi:hypothetical protein|uniref:hypothetical protein n=1 Tax=Microcoleus sp. PH2017_30_WIL_O_A TaxID=2798840 RepID=UPI001DC59F6B|nr:hypothetical protein [Microcoleus sp. PH2017_30_WIL_O_A]MCC3587446.1 hypothetical protein [Microcoleus sp. PH2017_30_WIL_O_A]